jgi:hypothetical protein
MKTSPVGVMIEVPRRKHIALPTLTVTCPA